MEKKLNSGGINIVVGKEGVDTKFYDNMGYPINLCVISTKIESDPGEVTTATIVYVANVFGTEGEMLKVIRKRDGHTV